MNARLFSIASIVIALASLTGCASTQSHTRDMLSKAGFREVRPETPTQLDLYATAPAYKIHKITSKGKTFYAYKDEKRGTAFVGDELKFRQFQLLQMEESAEQKQLQAEMMQPHMAVGWYGAYGPFLGPSYIGPRYGAIRRYR